MMYRIGHSQDTHKLVKNRRLVLGGINIPHDMGLLGHSDADVVLHVVAESIIGALGLGDLGMLFPDNDPQYKNANSEVFVIEAMNCAKNAGYYIGNIDITVFLEQPHLQEYKEAIKNNISRLLETSNVNIKATRAEGLGYIGRMEGITATAVVLLIAKPKFQKLSSQ